MVARTNYSTSSMTSARYIPSIIEIARSEQKATARRGLALFFFLLLPLSSLCYWLIMVQHTTFGTFFLMWTPGLAALVTRLVLREQSLPNRLNGQHLRSAVGIALCTPLAIALLAYGFAWGVGAAPLTYFHLSATLASFLPWLGANPSLLALLVFALFVGCAEIISATGEELGWRGYMLTHLIDAEVPQPVLLSGLIWSLWHWPLILLSPSVNGQPQVVTACIFLITITSLGCVSAHLRLMTGSLWPSILLHAAWNGIILEVFNAFTKDVDASIWTGEAGLLVAFITMFAALIIVRSGPKVQSEGDVKNSAWSQAFCKTGA